MDSILLPGVLQIRCPFLCCSLFLGDERTKQYLKCRRCYSVESDYAICKRSLNLSAWHGVKSVAWYLIFGQTSRLKSDEAHIEMLW